MVVSITLHAFAYKNNSIELQPSAIIGAWHEPGLLQVKYEHGFEEHLGAFGEVGYGDFSITAVFLKGFENFNWNERRGE